MLVLRTSNFQGATIRSIVSRHKHSIVLLFTTKFLVAACLKTANDKNLYIKISRCYGELRCFIFSVVILLQMILHLYMYKQFYMSTADF